MGFRALLWNGGERRFRAPVRVTLLTVVTALFVVGTSLGASLGLGGLRSLIGGAFGAAAAATAVAVAGVGFVGGAVTLSVLIAARYVDRRRLGDLGLRIDRGWWLDCGFGLALGATLMTLVFVVELTAGWIRVTGLVRPRADFGVRFLGLVAVFVGVGVYEELLSRGYLLTNAAEGLVGRIGERGAVGGGVLLTSLLFGLGHTNNPNATLASTVAIVIAGGMLAAGYVLTGELAIPIGLHVTWNLFQGGVYGFPVSGLGVDASVVAVEETGPDVVTGGAFGPEAGLIGIAAMTLGTVAIAAWSRWRTGTLAFSSAVTSPDLRPVDTDGLEPTDPERWEPAPPDRD
jgi:membrane protease YdiL (CAAX protease family)